jgi:hypothetical protein
MVLVPRTGYAGCDFSSNLQLLGNPATPLTGGQSAGGPGPYHGAHVYMEDLSENVVFDALQKRWTTEDRTIYVTQTPSNFSAQALLTSNPVATPYYFALMADDFKRLYAQIGTGQYHSPYPSWNSCKGTSATQGPAIARCAASGALILNGQVATTATYAASGCMLAALDPLAPLNAGATLGSGTVASGSTINGFVGSSGTNVPAAGIMTLGGVTGIPFSFVSGSTTFSFLSPLSAAPAVGTAYSITAPGALKSGITFETKLAMDSVAGHSWGTGLQDTAPPATMTAATEPLTIATGTIAAGATTAAGNAAGFFFSSAATTPTVGFQVIGAGTYSTSLGGTTAGTANQVFTNLGSSNNLQPLCWLGLRMVVSLTGYVSFYTNAYDGYGWVYRGANTDHPLALTAGLYPYIYNFDNTTATAHTLYVDYVFVREF